MGIQQTYGDKAYENLYDPFENVGKPKSFNKTVVRPMIGPEKDPEILERPSEAKAPFKVADRPASSTTPTEKKGRGRPKSDRPKPWEALGLSQAAYYRKKSKGEV